MAAEPVGLVLYGRGYCHLCDDMREALRPFEQAGRLRVTVIDVDSDPDLEDRFGEKVPLLFHGDVEICHYFLDSRRLDEVLGAIR